MKTIGITGGTGFVGSYLTKMLIAKGYKVIIFTRQPGKHQSSNPNISFAFWDPAEDKCDNDAMDKANAFVHLAGAGIADERWTPERKKLIERSRVEGTEFLVKQLRARCSKCKTLIIASAIGYYGGDERKEFVPFKETTPPEDDFLGRTCLKWEQASEPADEFLRRVVLRFGIVLGKNNGAYEQFAKPQRFGVVPILGSGKQVVSWIHVDDLCSIIVKALEDVEMTDTYNAVAPHPTSNEKLMKAIAKEKGGIKIPVPIPAFALKLGLGEMSTEILKSCTVSAEKILAAGFTFRFDTIEKAVHDLES